MALDCTAGGGTIPTLLGIEALKRKGGTLLIQGEGLAEFPNFPFGKIANKYITVKAARGHNYESCELALKQLNSTRFPPGPDHDPSLRVGEDPRRNQGGRQ